MGCLSRKRRRRLGCGSRRRRRHHGRLGGRARTSALLETELNILLELAELIPELPVFVLQLLDLAGHLPDLALEPAHADDELRRVLGEGR